MDCRPIGTTVRNYAEMLGAVVVFALIPLTARQDISPFNYVYPDDPKVLVFPDDTNFKLTLTLLSQYQKHISLHPSYTYHCLMMSRLMRSIASFG